MKSQSLFQISEHSVSLFTYRKCDADLIYMYTYIYILFVGKTAHHKVTGTSSHSFHSWLKTDQKVITAADVIQYKRCVWSFYDFAYRRQIARQLEQLHKRALKSVIQGEKKEWVSCTSSA